MISWMVWGVILILQNATFVAVSRARNSDRLGYHAITNVGANGVFIISQFFALEKISTALTSKDWWLASGIFVFYVIMNLIGGLVTHHQLMKRSL